jgi:hypothetical protein
MYIHAYFNSPTIANCTFAGNFASSEGGGLYYDGDLATITNSIVWANSDARALVGTIAYSDIEGTALVGTDGNIDQDPRFAAVDNATGSWTDVWFDDSALQTVLTASESTWTAGSLDGMFVQPDTGDDRRFVIAGNTASEIRVWGNLTQNPDGNDYVEAKDAYQLFDLHLGAGSPCIDAADASSGPKRDAGGGYRYDDPAAPNTGNGPPWADMGALEHGSGTPVDDPVCGMPVEWAPYNRLYWACDEGSTWAEAAEHCISLGQAHLVTIGNPLENEFVLGLIGDAPAWIGTNDIAEEETWTWITEEAWGYENWVEAHPYVNTDYNCAQMNAEPSTAGQWLDVVCDNLNGFVCESIF